MENFAALAGALRERHGAIRVNSETELKSAIAELLQNPAHRQELVVNAARALDAHRGATTRTARLIIEFRG
jgi:3-deoxy-D-manno-octulosonic-acid transferase